MTISNMTAIVRRYTKNIRNGRTPATIIRHMRGEVEELQEEIDGTGDGRDGIVGESIDIIACALDMIFEVQPDITDEQIDAIMEAKCAKWARKVNEGAYETEGKGMKDRFAPYVGKHYDEISEIKAAYPHMDVQFIPAGSAVTMDFREDRIRVWYNIDTKMVMRITVG